MKLQYNISNSNKTWGFVEGGNVLNDCELYQEELRRWLVSCSKSRHVDALSARGSTWSVRFLL
jgi:hypothetical protein